MAVTALPWSVEELLPHSGPMVLLDEALSAEEGRVTAAVRIAEDSLFYDPELGGVPAWVGIEYMAQTIAIYAGVHAKRAGEPVRVGLLLGSRRYQTETGCFPLGSRLLIHAREEWRDESMAVFDCRIETDACLAKAMLNVYQPEDIQAILERFDA